MQIVYLGYTICKSQSNSAAPTIHFWDGGVFSHSREWLKQPRPKMSHHVPDLAHRCLPAVLHKLANRIGLKLHESANRAGAAGKSAKRKGSRQRVSWGCVPFNPFGATAPREVAVVGFVLSGAFGLQPSLGLVHLLERDNPPIGMLGAFAQRAGRGLVLAEEV